MTNRNLASDKVHISTKRKQKHAIRLVETWVGDLQEKEVCGNIFVNTKGKCRKHFWHIREKRKHIGEIKGNGNEGDASCLCVKFECSYANQPVGNGRNTFAWLACPRDYE